MFCNIPSSYHSFNEVEFSKEDSKIIWFLPFQSQQSTQQLVKLIVICKINKKKQKKIKKPKQINNKKSKPTSDFHVENIHQKTAQSF